MNVPHYMDNSYLGVSPVTFGKAMVIPTLDGKAWALPGGGWTRSKARAVHVAKQIHMEMMSYE